jgi:hypothetical protein
MQPLKYWKHDSVRSPSTAQSGPQPTGVRVEEPALRTFGCMLLVQSGEACMPPRQQL